MSRADRPDLARWHAAILHREHPSVDALKRQLELLHVKVTVTWPRIDADAMRYDVVFFDADMGHEGQFPWPGGFAPMPMIALIGSEAPAVSNGRSRRVPMPTCSNRSDQLAPIARF